MEFDHQIYLLSQKFIKDHPLTKYPELMYKQGRPYTCLLIETYEDYFLCVPFRSSINHNNAYIFKETRRAKRTRSGLDYSKTVVIQNDEYIDSTKTAVVDQDEYAELMKNLILIVREVLDYVNGYINHKNGMKPLHPRDYSRKYGFSTLPYFDILLGIEDSESVLENQELCQ